MNSTDSRSFLHFGAGGRPSSVGFVRLAQNRDCKHRNFQAARIHAGTERVSRLFRDRVPATFARYAGFWRAWTCRQRLRWPTRARGCRPPFWRRPKRCLDWGASTRSEKWSRSCPSRWSATRISSMRLTGKLRVPVDCLAADWCLAGCWMRRKRRTMSCDNSLRSDGLEHPLKN